MDDRYQVKADPFGTWLAEQSTTARWFAPLAKAAAADRRFPRRGDAEEVRKHLASLGAEADWFEMLDDAELDWSAL